MLAYQSKSKKKLEVSVLRVPFFLEPDYGDDVCITNLERLKRKWGGSGGFEAQKKRHGLKERGREVGIEDFKSERLASQTMPSHRLVQWISRTHGLKAAEDLYAELNHIHFIEGHKLNDFEALASAAHKTLDVPKEETVKFLRSQDQAPTADAIRTTYAYIQSLGIHAIPTFIINATHIVRGAAHADEFENILNEIEANNEPLKPPVFADLLGISNDVLLRDDAIFQPKQIFAPC